MVANAHVMSRLCIGIDLQCEEILVHHPISKEVVEYFIKTVYLREKAIGTIPPALFKEVVALAFDYDAWDWEEHLSTANGNLLLFDELKKDTGRSQDVRRKAEEYVKNISSNNSSVIMDEIINKGSRLLFEKCDKSLKSKKPLTQHQKRPRACKPYPVLTCPTCKNTFDRDIRRHGFPNHCSSYKPANEFPFSCSLFERKYKSLDALRLHNRLKHIQGSSHKTKKLLSLTSLI